MISGWREFPFFDVLPIRDPDPNAPLYSDPNLLAVAPAKDTVFYSTRDGKVSEFTEDLKLVRSFQVVDSSWSTEILKVLPNHSILITLSTQLGQPTKVALWDISKPSNVAPKLVSTVNVVNASNTFPLTTFSCADDASVMALGYADGAVIVVRGDIIHDRGSRQRHIYTATSAVTGLELAPGSDNSLLYVTSLLQVVTMSTTGKSFTNKPAKLLEKEEGSQYGCAAVYKEDLVVARNAKIVYYSSHHRGPTLQFEVPKRSIHIYKHYIVLVTVFSQTNSALEAEILRVVILDTRNHLVAYNGHIALGIKHVFSLWDRINIIGTDGVLYTLKEKSLQAQLSILTQQQLYQTAITVAQSAGSDAKQIMLLHQQYGDYLQDKDDSENALKHYIAAIDLGDTSHVILRYKDSQKTTVLTAYLEALFEKGLATPQHLTLLVICYTNLADSARLERFLQKAVLAPEFDFQAAIDICRNSKYFELASLVAGKWPDPDLVVQIQLRDIGDYKRCLDYILTVSVSDALRLLIQNSRLLLNELPVETTGVLITLFTGKFIPKSAEVSHQDHTENETTEIDNIYAKPVLQSYKAFTNYISSTAYRSTNLVDAKTLETKQETPSYLPPRPRLIFPSFIGHDNEFVIFLEACLESAPDFQPSDRDLSDVVTTLYEVYIQLSSKDSGNAEDWRQKSNKLIQEHGSLLDSNIVIMVAKSVNVDLAPEQRRALGTSDVDIFREYVEQGKIEKAVEILHNAKDSHVQRDVVSIAFRSLSTSKSLLEALRPELTELMDKAVLERWLSPIQLVQIVCQSPYMTIGDVKPFLLKHVERERGEVTYNEKIGKSYEDENTTKREQLEALKNDPVIVQYGNCSLCMTPLDLPAVHFACKHSYHQRCIGDSLNCPIDLAENESIKAIRNAQVETANIKGELFIESLDGRKDRLRVINDFISRGGLSIN